MIRWCIRCMTWVGTETGYCPVCGATTLDEPPTESQVHECLFCQVEETV